MGSKFKQHTLRSLSPKRSSLPTHSKRWSKNRKIKADRKIKSKNYGFKYIFLSYESFYILFYILLRLYLPLVGRKTEPCCGFFAWNLVSV